MSNVDPADFEMLRPAVTGDGLIEISGDAVRILAEMAKNTSDYFEKCATRDMTPDVAKAIRIWRVQSGYTWRAVARSAHDEFNFTWIEPPYNQLAGVALCEVAAALFNEDGQQGPWN
jgi:hypothetical protein